MNIFNIQSLISRGRVAKLSDIDPEKAYVQVGVYQQGNRAIGSGNANTYKECAIPLSELGGGGTTPNTGIVVIKRANVRLFSPDPQPVTWPTEGLYIIQGAYLTNPNGDFSGLTSKINLQLILPNSVIMFKTFNPMVLPGLETLSQLIATDNFIKMIDSAPLCFPPPCNGNFVYDAATAGQLAFQVEVPTIGTERVDAYVQLLRIA